MKISRLIFRDLWFYRKPYLAVLAGATISIAILTGALTVGDSVRFSLQKLTDARLGKTRFVLQSGDHLFNATLATSLSREINENIAPLLISEGIAINSEKEKRMNRVDVIGIDRHFPLFWDENIQIPKEDEAIISENSASKLELKVGDEFLLRIRKQGNSSPNAPFSAEKTSSVALRLKVKAVASENQMGRFSLKSNQAAPFNIFISLNQLNYSLGLNGKSNLLLIGTHQQSLEIVKPDSLLNKIWQPSDAGLMIRKIKGSNQFEITSERIFMDEKVSGPILSSIPGCSGILTYLANSLQSNDRSTPYSFVSACDESFLHQQLTDKEVIINEWLSDDLKVRKGDSLTMKYFVMGSLQSLKENSARFIIKSIISMKDPMCDPSLMPEFPGIRNSGNCRDWETATPIDMKRIREKDEKYWKDYRGTPKAFISLKAGQQLWHNRFGSYTAFRFTSSDQQIKKLERSIMEKLRPAENGMSFLPVYEMGRSSAANSTDFGVLFLSLSFFIIVSGLLLMAMIFSVQTHTRLKETGILSAMGFKKSQVILILFAEAAIIVVLAGIIGSFAGIGYNRLLLWGLNTLWQDSVRTSSLEMHNNLSTLLIGAAGGIVMAMLVMFWILYRNLRNPLVVLIRGSKTPPVLKRGRFQDYNPHFPRFFSLVVKNSKLNLTRTIGAITLLAIGNFTIVITGANRRSFQDELNNRHSGTGGFLFWAESTIPLRNDLNTLAGKKQFGIEQDSTIRNVRFLHLYRLEGEDASCLNLNRAAQPVLLGVNAAYFDKVSAFSFQDLNPAVNALHPWKMLERPLSNGVIPGFADQTVIKWGLGKSIGDTLVYKDESGKSLRIKLMAGLDNSIFQGNILISDNLFRIYYPSVGGSKIMLLDGAFSQKQAIGDEMEQIFRDYGIVVTPADQRLDDFNSVQNTYLSVFMLLGGLGVIIGTFGLGFLLIRNLIDRQNEIAIYQALGFQKSYIIKLLTAEHLLILISGMGIGIIVSIPVIFPALMSPTSNIPYTFLAVLLSLIFISGYLWIIFPLRAAMKKDLLKNLSSL